MTDTRNKNNEGFHLIPPIPAKSDHLKSSKYGLKSAHSGAPPKMKKEVTVRTVSSSQNNIANRLVMLVAFVMIGFATSSVGMAAVLYPDVLAKKIFDAPTGSRIEKYVANDSGENSQVDSSQPVLTEIANSVRNTFDSVADTGISFLTSLANGKWDVQAPKITLPKLHLASAFDSISISNPFKKFALPKTPENLNIPTLSFADNRVRNILDARNASLSLFVPDISLSMISMPKIPEISLPAITFTNQNLVRNVIALQLPQVDTSRSALNPSLSLPSLSDLPSLTFSDSLVRNEVSIAPLRGFAAYVGSELSNLTENLTLTSKNLYQDNGDDNTDSYEEAVDLLAAANYAVSERAWWTDITCTLTGWFGVESDECSAQAQESQNLATSPQTSTQPIASSVPVIPEPKNTEPIVVARNSTPINNVYNTYSPTIVQGVTVDELQRSMDALRGEFAAYKSTGLLQTERIFTRIGKSRSGSVDISTIDGSTITDSDVSGTFTGDVIADSFEANGALQLNDITPPGDTTDLLYNDGGALYWNGTAITGTVGNWSTSGGNVYRATGNVGIGTTSPYALLSVAGSGVFDNKVTASYFIATSTTASVLPYASTTALTVSGSNGLTLGSLNGPLQAISGAVSASSTISIAYGGTGLSSAPAYGQLLLGNSSGAYALTATSSLGFLTTDVGEGSNLYYTNTRARGAISSSATGLSYDNSTGIFSLTSGYSIPLTASTTNWNDFYDTPSTRISAGSGLTWTGNSLSVSGITSSQWTTSGSNIYYTTGNVGIGTTSPYSMLSVAGQVVAQNFVATSTTATSSANIFSVGSTTPGSTSMFSVGTSSPLLTVSSQNTYVGVGTSIPASALDVLGRIMQTGSASITGYMSTNSGLLASVTSLNPGVLVYGSPTGAAVNYYGMDLGYSSASSRYRTRIFAPTTGDIAFSTHVAATAPTAQSSFTDVMTILGTNGNVGIGTTSPYSMLSVAGQVVAQNFVATSTTATSTIGTAGLAVGTTTPWGNGFFTIGTSSPNFIVDRSSGYVGVGTTTPNALLNIYNKTVASTKIETADNGLSTLRIGEASDYRGGFIKYDGTVNIFTIGVHNNSDSVTASDINAISVQRSSGNIGIGTSTPNNIFDIYSTSKAAIGFTGASGSTYKWTIGMDVTNGGRFAIASSTALGTTDRFVIDGNGNVGIGTTSPYSMLSVAGQVVAQNFVATSTTATSSAMIFSVGSTTPGSVSMFSVGTSSALLHVGAVNGYVGIGNTDPMTTLDVGTNSLIPGSTLPTATKLFIRGNYVSGTTDATYGAILMGVDGNAYYGSIFNSRRDGNGRVHNQIGTRFAGSNTVAIDITDTGLVGIGTTSPYAKLSVAGEVVAQNFVATSTTATSTIGTAGLAVGTTTPWGNGLFTVGTTSPLFYIDRNSGNIGIGTSSPGYKLGVEGTAYVGSTLTVAGGATSLTNGTANRIEFGTAGVAAPGTNSAGLKIKLYGTNGAMASGDYGLGVESGNMWLQGSGFKWYYGVGSSLIATLNSAGNFIAVGTLTGTNLNQTVYSVTIPTTVGDATEFASVTNTSFSSNVELWYTVHNGGFAQSKRYIVPVQYDGTSGAWQKLLPISTTGAYSGNDAEIDVNISTVTATFRIRRTVGSTAGTAKISLAIGGDIANTTVSSASATYTGASVSVNFAPTSLTMKNGKTGVNNDAPTGYLDVVGTSEQLRVGYDTSNYLSTTISSAGAATFNLTGTSPIFNFTGGNFGIGSSSPYSKLSVAGQVVAQNFVATSTTATSTIGTAGLAIGTSTPPTNALFTVGTSSPSFYVDRSTGYVNVGGISTLDLFTVKPMIPTNGSEIFSIGRMGCGSGYMGFAVGSVGGNTCANYNFISDGNNAFFNAPSASGAVIFRVQNSTKMQMTAAGKLGIGTTTPNNMLDLYSTSKAAIGFSGASGDTYKWTIGMDVTNAGRFAIASSTALGTTDRFVIDGNGSVGVATTSPWRTLSVVGTMSINGLTAAASTADAVCLNGTTKEVLVNTGAATCTVSSNRFKHNISPLNSSIDSVMRLRPVTYIYNGDEEERVGLIAEEVAEIDPRFIFREADGRPRGVRYEDLVALLAKAMQEQNGRIDTIDRSVTDLTQRMSEMVTLLGGVSTSTLANALESGGIFGQTGFIGMLRTALASSTTWTIDRISSMFARVEHIDTDVITVQKGIEIKDSETGEIYCLYIKKGDVEHIKGSCEESIGNSHEGDNDDNQQNQPPDNRQDDHNEDDKDKIDNIEPKIEEPAKNPSPNPEPDQNNPDAQVDNPPQQQILDVPDAPDVPADKRLDNENETPAEAPAQQDSPEPDKVDKAEPDPSPHNDAPAAGADAGSPEGGGN